MALSTVIFIQIAVMTVMMKELESCDIFALNDCIQQFGTPGDDGNYNCDISSFDDCTRAGGITSCTGESAAIATSIDNIRQLLSSDQCLQAGNTGIICQQYLQQCITTTQESLGPIDATNPELLKNLICFCENGNSVGSSFETCLEESGYNACPEAVKTPNEHIINSITSASNPTCDLLKGNSCQCAEQVDACTTEHLGSDFRQKLVTANEQDIRYPNCLHLGTEQQFQQTLNCLLGLPESCGLQNYTLLDLVNFSPNNSTIPPYGYATYVLAYSCTPGCLAANALNSSISTCLSTADGQSDLTDQDLQNLGSQEKSELCNTLKQSTECVLNIIGKCPRDLQILSELTRSGEESDSIPGAAELTTRLAFCNMTVPSYADTVGTNDSQRVISDLLFVVVLNVFTLFCISPKTN